MKQLHETVAPPSNRRCWVSYQQLHRYEARQQEHGEELADHALERGQATGDGSEGRDVAITGGRERRHAEVQETEAERLRNGRGREAER